MTEKLKTSIEGLYSSFSRYPLRTSMEGCPCCVSDKDKEKIHTKKLRQLDGDDLSRYAFKAMTTWGTTDDFKHYLPRIFELLSTTDFIVDTFVVLGKLDYGNWTTWPAEEQKAIQDFLMAWWIDMTMHKTYLDNDAFIEIYKLLSHIDPLIDNWTISFEDNSFKNLIDFLEHHYHNLTNRSSKFREVDQASIEKLIAWAKDKHEIIERGFFHYVNIDKAFAQKISNTLLLIEQTT